MSQQSIHTVNFDSIYEEVKNNIESSAKNYKLYNYYKLGKETCKDVIDHNCMMYDIMKNPSCDRVDLINALQQPNFVKTKYSIKDGSIVIDDNSDKLYKIWLSKGNVGSIEDFYDTITQNTIDKLTIWEDVEW